MNTPKDDNKDSAGGLSKTELFGLFGRDKCPLHRRTPHGMRNVSMTQLSIARHYGGIKYNGEEYTYLPQTDELIRNDVLKWQTKNAKECAAKNRDSQTEIELT